MASPRRSTRRPIALAWLSGLLCGAIAGCFTGDGLRGQPCRADDDCDAVAAAFGERVRCSDGVCGAVCGDGVLSPGAEECDDGNERDDDSCVDCKLAVCGDGVLRPDREACDDGNSIASDACVGCQVATCGDGFVWADHELCDDGNDSATDACVACRPVRCGDGEVNPATEGCDDGDGDDDDGCNASCEAGAEQLSVGAVAHHTCVLHAGAARCWGDGQFGQLGNGERSLVGDEPSDLPPRDVALGAARVTQVAAGVFHTCALLAVGPENVRCWGFSGFLGLPGVGDDVGDAAGELPPPAVEVGGPAIAIAVAQAHSCVVLADGGVRCWGDGEDGRLGQPCPNFDICASVGDDEAPGSLPPVKLAGEAVAVTLGFNHTCALLADGEVRCWGYNARGGLGVGHTDHVGVGDGGDPQNMGPVPLGGAAVQIAAGGGHTCAVLDGGDVRCWGENEAGQLGYGHTEDIGDDERPDALAPVALGAPAVWIAAGRAHTCAILERGAVRCWGANDSGQLGGGHAEVIGDDEQPDARPPVVLPKAVRQITAGREHTCVVLTGGEVRCWGIGGALGIGRFPAAVGLVPGDMPPDPAILFDNPRA